MKILILAVLLAAWPGTGAAGIDSDCENAAKLTCEATAQGNGCRELRRELAAVEKILAATPKPPPKPPFESEPRPVFSLEEQVLRPNVVGRANLAWMIRNLERQAAYATQADRDYAEAESNASSARWKAKHYCLAPFDTSMCIGLKMLVCSRQTDLPARQAK